MASGNLMCSFFAQDNEPPASNYATLDTRNGHPVLDFDASTDETAVFSGVLPAHYSGGGLTVTLGVAFSSATTGTGRFDVSIERIDDSSLDIDADSFASAQSVAIAAPGTSGQVKYATVAFTSGAQMDSLAAGEAFRLKVTRDADGTGGTDDATGDAELRFVKIVET